MLPAFPDVLCSAYFDLKFRDMLFFLGGLVDVRPEQFQKRSLKRVAVFRGVREQPGDIVLVLGSVPSVAYREIPACLYHIFSAFVNNKYSAVVPVIA